MIDKKIGSLLGDISSQTFLEEYWQKKPLLVRQAFSEFSSPLSPDDLAGLACEPDVNSRIVIEKGGEHTWQAIHGPMDEDIFSNMPNNHWTLVVNDVEKYIPELAWITDKFRFIPEWFLDDLMVSWAADQGSVGPHVDLYDVFILQGSGSRCWQISTQPIAEDNFIPDIALRLLKEFEPQQEWILEPGDMLYLPPGVAHHGVSRGESISYSIGYRATSHHDLVNDFIADITQDLSINKTYKMPDLAPQRHPNEIKPEAIQQLRTILTEYLDPQHPALSSWFGRFVSDPKANYEMDEFGQPIETFRELSEFVELQRNPASRFAFIRVKENSQLFIDGEQYEVSSQFAESLCQNRLISLVMMSDCSSEQEKQILVDLFNTNKLSNI